MSLRIGKIIVRREFNKILATQAIMKRLAQLATNHQDGNDLIVYNHNQIPITNEHGVDHSQDDDHFTGVDDHDEGDDGDAEPNGETFTENNDNGNEEEETACNDNNNKETSQHLHDITGVPSPTENKGIREEELDEVHDLYTPAIDNTNNDEHSDTNTNTLVDAEVQQPEIPTIEDPPLIETTETTDVIEPTTEPTTLTMEPITEPSDDPTYYPTATDAENAPIDPAQEQKVENEEEDEENVFEKAVDSEPTESQDENNDNNTDTNEQELLQEINNSLAPTTSPDNEALSLLTRGVSWADAICHDNDPNVLSSASTTPSPAKA
eukprot:4620811-Ditylum_brightwellii.AAC.1